MPRKQVLGAIVPNRYYDLQAKVKYLHHTVKGTTAIIQQDEVQKKLIIPPRSVVLEQGVEYRFPKCFYVRSGWLKVKEGQNVERIQRQPEQSVSLSLEELNERRNELSDNYVTTLLQVVSIGEPEQKQKNGNQLTLTLLKGFAQNALVDITIWNQEVSPEILGQIVRFQGFRVKMLTNNTFVLVSTVFSTLNIAPLIMQTEQFHPQKLYPSYSQVYAERTISQMRYTLKDLTKCFSIVQATVVEATIFDYEGCKACHKKMEGALCSHCIRDMGRQTFWVCQLEVEDSTGNCSLFVFNAVCQDMLQHAKKGSVIKAKIRSTVRLDTTGDSNMESHTLVAILSIQF